MNKINVKKDGKGNIIISEDSFEMILSCLDNQKSVGESPQNLDSKGKDQIQDDINYNIECRKILHQKYVLRTKSDGYYLIKRYEFQNEDIEWTSKDVKLIYELFKQKEIKKETLLIERSLFSDYIYLTISEDGQKNRPWKKEEIDEITKILNKKK